MITLQSGSNPPLKDCVLALQDLHCFSSMHIHPLYRRPGQDNISARYAGMPEQAAGAGAGAQAPEWAALPAQERAQWMQATVLQAVSATLGRPVGLEEPLMTAGLDSLGSTPSRLYHLHLA